MSSAGSPFDQSALMDAIRAISYGMLGAPSFQAGFQRAAPLLMKTQQDNEKKQQYKDALKNLTAPASYNVGAPPPLQRDASGNLFYPADAKIPTSTTPAGPLNGLISPEMMPLLSQIDPSVGAPLLLKTALDQQQHAAMAKAFANSAQPSEQTPQPSQAEQPAATPQLLDLVPTLENSGDNAVSPKGAVGRYQIMPATAQQYGFDSSKLKDPAYNAQAAQAVAADLAKRYPGDLPAQLIAYNAGPGVADRFIAKGRDPSILPKETQGYLAHASQLVGQQSPQPAPQQVAQAQPDMMGQVQKLVAAGVDLPQAITLAKASMHPRILTPQEAKAKGFSSGTIVQETPEGADSVLQTPREPKSPVAANPGQAFYDPTTGKITTPVLSDYDRLYGEAAATGKKADVQRRMYDMSAWNYLRTNHMPALGFKNNDARQTIMERSGEIAQQIGLDPQDVAAMQAGFGASASALKKVANYGAMMTGFQTALDSNANYVRTLLKGAGTTGSPVFNRWQRYVKGQYQGDPDVIKLNNAILTVNNSYAKISSGSIGASGSSDASRAAAHTALNADMTVPQILAALDVMHTESRNETGGFSATQSNIQEGLSGLPGHPTPQAQPTAATDSSKIIRYDAQGNRIQ